MFSYVQNRHGHSVIIGLASELASKVGEIVHVNTSANVARLEIVQGVGKAFKRDGQSLCYGYPDRSIEARDRIVEAEARFAKLAAAKATSVARAAAEASASVAADLALVQMGKSLAASRAAEAPKVAPKAKRAPKVAAKHLIDSTLPAAPSVSDAWNDFRDMLLAKAG